MNFLEALIPVIVMVALGHFLASRNIPSAEGWRAIERLCYLVLFPALIVLVLARAPLDTAPWKIAVTLLVAQVVLAGAGLLAVFWPGIARPAIGSIIQSNSRWNTFFGSALR